MELLTHCHGGITVDVEMALEVDPRLDRVPELGPKLVYMATAILFRDWKILRRTMFLGHGQYMGQRAP